MQLIRYLLSMIILCLISSFCTTKTQLSKDQIEILKIVRDTFLSDEEVLYSQTYDKATVEREIGKPVSKQIFQINFYLADANLDSLFDESILNGLDKSLTAYQSIDLSSLPIDLGSLVSDEDIPEYVINRIPTPNWEVDFVTVLYISTPIVYENRAVLLSKKTGDIPVGISFFVKENRKWKIVGD